MRRRPFQCVNSHHARIDQSWRGSAAVPRRFGRASVMNRGDVPLSLQRRVRLRAGHRCEYCHIPQAGQEATFHVDHVLPRLAGGLTTLQNLALVCVSYRLWVSLILDFLASGMSIQEIMAEYDVEEADVRACIEYGA